MQSVADNEPGGEFTPALWFNANVHSTRVNVINRGDLKATQEYEIPKSCCSFVAFIPQRKTLLAHEHLVSLFSRVSLCCLLLRVLLIQRPPESPETPSVRTVWTGTSSVQSHPDAEGLNVIFSTRSCAHILPKNRCLFSQHVTYLIRFRSYRVCTACI